MLRNGKIGRWQPKMATYERDQSGVDTRLLNFCIFKYFDHFFVHALKLKQ